MSVAQNAAFELQRRRAGRLEIRSRVGEMLAMPQMSGLEARKPDQLSGGQRQRVALSGSLITRPQLLLLDEPLGALDKRLRETTQFEMLRLQRELGFTCVVVTHDQEEALGSSHRIAAMRAGRIIQIGTPRDVYETPNSRAVADFIGSNNLLSGEILEIQDDFAVVDSPEFDCRIKAPRAAAFSKGDKCWVALRPENLVLETTLPPSRWNCVQGEIVELAYLGGQSICLVRSSQGRHIRAAVSSGTAPQEMDSRSAQPCGCDGRPVKPCCFAHERDIHHAPKGPYRLAASDSDSGHLFIAGRFSSAARADRCEDQRRQIDFRKTTLYTDVHVPRHYRRRITRLGYV